MCQLSQPQRNRPTTARLTAPRSLARRFLFQLYCYDDLRVRCAPPGPPTIALKGLIQIGKNSERMSVLRGLLRRPNCPDFTRLSRLQAAFVRTFYQAYIQRKNRVFLLKIAPDTSHGMSGLPVGIVEALWVMSACGTSIWHQHSGPNEARLQSRRNRARAGAVNTHSMEFLGSELTSYQIAARR